MYSLKVSRALQVILKELLHCTQGLLQCVDMLHVEKTVMSRYHESHLDFYYRQLGMVTSHWTTTSAKHASPCFGCKPLFQKNHARVPWGRRVLTVLNVRRSTTYSLERLTLTSAPCLSMDMNAASSTMLLGRDSACRRPSECDSFNTCKPAATPQACLVLSKELCEGTRCDVTEEGCRG